MSIPTVMVSSTFYDLKQIRTDIGHFLSKEMGYTPLLSELPSFPIDPNRDTIENCRKRVEESADILILIIGGRYGSIDDKTAKSVTNLEYLTARKIGIPVYTFIEKHILSILPLWKKNPDADYSNVVDTTSLFQFVEEIRQIESKWTFPFETAQDIITTLRIQFAYLFSDSLQLRRRLGENGIPPDFEILSPKALKIALDKPEAWEYFLFFQVLIDENQKHEHMFKEYKAGLLIGTSEQVEIETAIGWIQTRLRELKGLINSANQLLSKSLQEAFGEPGQAGDADEIIWNAKKLSEVTEEAVKWALLIRKAKVAEPFTNVIAAMSEFPTSAIERLQFYPIECIPQIENALKGASSGTPISLELILKLELNNVEGFSAALAEAERRFNAGDY
ncbi:MAG: DUF4062 domain-containing protein [Calditrichia bacterium]|nr:DUF4062 domain-containing protein [Calditrichia bacterium]